MTHNGREEKRERGKERWRERERKEEREPCNIYTQQITPYIQNKEKESNTKIDKDLDISQNKICKWSRTI